jgi:hypothetical protein
MAPIQSTAPSHHPRVARGASLVMDPDMAWSRGTRQMIASPALLKYEFVE